MNCNDLVGVSNQSKSADCRLIPNVNCGLSFIFCLWVTTFWKQQSLLTDQLHAIPSRTITTGANVCSCSNFKTPSWFLPDFQLKQIIVRYINEFNGLHFITDIYCPTTNNASPIKLSSLILTWMWLLLVFTKGN